MTGNAGEGSTKEGRLWSLDDLEWPAFFESGHAVVAEFFGHKTTRLAAWQVKTESDDAGIPETPNSDLQTAGEGQH